MSTFKLRITGKASITKLAEQANLRVNVSSTGTDKQAVSRDVLKTTKCIEDMKTQMLAGITSAQTSPLPHWSQTSLSTQSWLHYEPFPQVSQMVKPSHGSSLFGNKPTAIPEVRDVGPPVRHYKAMVWFDVRFQDFDMLSEFCSHLTAIEHCQIESLTWILLQTTQNAHKSELRLMAARDACVKVKDYCQIVCPDQDVTIVPLELGGDSGGKHGTSFGSANAGGGLFSGSSTTAPSLSFAPQDIKMTLSVDMIFTVETAGFKASSI